ncbi:MAG TPA: Rrf2 family transcriptional regulator [Spirochaetia bacterium]|nr:Rrf2 family transcriptional regulator [Spirochaetia bacterium]
MPFQMSTRGRYGVRLMVALALKYGSGISLLREISLREGISNKYLGQIIIPLKAAGLVVSQRGSHGGYSLARPPEDITVRDVVEAIEGRIAPAPCAGEASSDPECFESPTACERATTCVVAGVWKKLQADIGGSLASFTLGSLARQARELKESSADYVI